MSFLDLLRGLSIVSDDEIRVKFRPFRDLPVGERIV